MTVTKQCFTCRTYFTDQDCPSCSKILMIWFGQAPDGKFLMFSQSEFAQFMAARGKSVLTEAVHAYEFQDGTKFARSIKAAMAANLPGLVAQMVKARVWEKA